VEYRQLVRLSHGEVEDYSIEIIDGNGNTNPPSKPTNLAASGTTTSSTNLSWNVLRMMKL
jgi:hypothetical protein